MRENENTYVWQLCWCLWCCMSQGLFSQVWFLPWERLIFFFFFFFFCFYSAREFEGNVFNLFVWLQGLRGFCAKVERQCSVHRETLDSADCRERNRGRWRGRKWGFCWEARRTVSMTRQHQLWSSQKLCIAWPFLMCGLFSVSILSLCNCSVGSVIVFFHLIIRNSMFGSQRSFNRDV